jgi:hypothetical protein
MKELESDPIASFPLRGASTEQLGIALARSEGEFLLWHGQAMSLADFPLVAQEAGVHTVLKCRVVQMLEFARAHNLLINTSGDVRSNDELAEVVVPQQLASFHNSAKVGAVVMLHSACERLLWRLVRFGIVKERGKAIDRVENCQLTIKELKETDRDSLIDQRLERWW